MEKVSHAALPQRTFTLTTRDATAADFEFLYQLKKSAEYDAVHTVFGWHEATQRAIHQQEWDEARPTLIEVNQEPAGSILFEHHGEHWYLGRFFLLPSFHGLGIGSQILTQLLQPADEQCLPVHLCYLQGNRVSSLYRRFGFVPIREDNHFVYMIRPPGTPQELPVRDD
ncbi:GNAT family N-acetyltransferase [Photobacterium sp. MCCC 1A19761]|uniref:GNAT family N-acetyltransferase n=1 Tax=Photobacterium sp. MCCC 1A19761 TaxID=3115000 RepID=UPI00307E94F7